MFKVKNKKKERDVSDVVLVFLLLLNIFFIFEQVNVNRILAILAVHSFVLY